jgi:hypothetical protein
VFVPEDAALAETHAVCFSSTQTMHSAPFGVCVARLAWFRVNLLAAFVWLHLQQVICFPTSASLGNLPKPGQAQVQKVHISQWIHFGTPQSHVLDFFALPTRAPTLLWLSPSEISPSSTSC